MVVLVSAGLSIAIGVWALWMLYRTGTGTKRRFLYMAIFLFIQLVAYGVALEDLFSSMGVFS